MKRVAFATLALAMLAGAHAGTDAPQGAIELGSPVIGGGATRGSAAGGLSLEGSAGQVDAFRGTAAGGISLDGGFWPIASALPSEVVFVDGFE